MAERPVVDVFYDTHEKHYKEWMMKQRCQSSPLAAQEYFHYRMFQCRDIGVESDHLRVSAMSFALHNYYVGGCMRVQENPRAAVFM
jgi:hypothetical protein